MYMFGLHAHHPTHSQIDRIVQRRGKDQAWQQWLSHIARPMDIAPNFADMGALGALPLSKML